MQKDSCGVQNMPPLGRRGRKRPLANPRFSPSTLSSLHHRRRNRRGRAGQRHSGAGVDDRDDFAGTVGRLLKVDVIGVGGGNASVNKGIGRGGREGDRWGDLLHRLDLMLQRRGVGRSAGERGAIGRGRVDRVQLQEVYVNQLFPG